MIHLGDIRTIKGANIPPVDVVTGGSPCQDLSVAGRRTGLAGARSGLFLDQIRIIKEMRDEYGTDFPRYMVWENVPGAFSANKGRDFATVLDETIRIAEPKAPGVHVPSKGWPTWGSFRDVDGGWSVAWRILDAQYWGVPQRRRRIALVADFNGGCAGKILFEPEGMSGYTSQSFRPWKETADRTQECTGKAGAILHPKIVGTICASGAGLNRPAGQGSETDLCIVQLFAKQRHDEYIESDISSCQQARQDHDATDLVVCSTKYNSVVRRLTPLECERLQGFPDNWTLISRASDSARYRALGNSIALPPWRFVMRRIYEKLRPGAKMGSLFDGIGGFPLIWRELGGTPVWASEIERFFYFGNEDAF